MVQQPKGLGQLDDGRGEREGGGELDEAIHQVRELVLSQEVGEVQEEILDQPKLGRGGGLAKKDSDEGVEGGGGLGLLRMSYSRRYFIEEICPRGSSSSTHCSALRPAARASRCEIQSRITSLPLGGMVNNKRVTNVV